MGLIIQYDEGQTPLEDDEKEALKIVTIETLDELNEYEQNSIEGAIQWMLSRPIAARVILTEDFIRRMHKRMFGEVWKWAGEYRKTNKNIGVDKWEIPIAIRSLLDDAKYWVAHTTYPPDEIALRFKHRLVSIHCFPNGNGRHSRLMADILVRKVFDEMYFSWGATLSPADARKNYLAAVKAADRNDMQPLLEFARS